MKREVSPPETAEDGGMSQTAFRLTLVQREKVKRNGGSAWVRRLIDEAPESREPAEPLAEPQTQAPAVPQATTPSEDEAKKAYWEAYNRAMERGLSEAKAEAAAAEAYARAMAPKAPDEPKQAPEPEPQTDFLAEAKAMGEAAYMGALPDVTGTFQEVFKPDFEKAHAHLPEVRAARAYAKAFTRVYAEGWADLWGALDDDAARDAQAVAKKEGLGPNLAFLIGFGVLGLVREAQAEAISPPAESEDL